MRAGLLIAAAAALAASPSPAAGHPAVGPYGAWRHGAVVGAYLSLPFDGMAPRPVRAGLRFRLAYAPDRATGAFGESVEADLVDLSFSHAADATLLIGGLAVTGRKAANLEAGSGETVALVAGGLAAAGLTAYLILDDRLGTDPGDDE